MRSLSKILCIGALVAVSAWFVGRNWMQARQLHAISLAGPEAWLDVLYPGTFGAALAVTEHGCRVVKGLPYDSDRGLYQRMTEMLYPIELVHVEGPGELIEGDVVVVRRAEQVERECTVIHASEKATVVVIDS